MPTPTNKSLYAKAKAKYSSMKHSAYKSGLVVKAYKKMGGKYSGKKDDSKGLGRWYKEDWRTEKGKKTYKEGGTIFRPTKRVNSKTPTTMKELTPAQKKKAIKEKKATGKVKKYKK
jgi:hypothetical protein|tara:strand:+ start:198 stop:545 length:348 start_codon:yes stop_codon:yes gene_type:complete